MIGLYLYIGLIQLPSVGAYFEHAPRYSIVADVIGRNRLEQLLTRIHFVNNNEVTDESRKDMLWKLMPWFSASRDNFLKVPPEEHHDVNEIRVAFRGNVGPRVYMTKTLQNGASSNGGVQVPYDIFTHLMYAKGNRGMMVSNLMQVYRVTLYCS